MTEVIQPLFLSFWFLCKFDIQFEELRAILRYCFCFGGVDASQIMRAHRGVTPQYVYGKLQSPYIDHERSRFLPQRLWKLIPSTQSQCSLPLFLSTPVPQQLSPTTHAPWHNYVPVHLYWHLSHYFFSKSAINYFCWCHSSLGSFITWLWQVFLVWI